MKKTNKQHHGTGLCCSRVLRFLGNIFFSLDDKELEGLEEAKQCFISQWTKRSKHGLLVFLPKKTLIWRRHCSIGQSFCSMTSKRFLESSSCMNEDVTDERNANWCGLFRLKGNLCDHFKHNAMTTLGKINCSEKPKQQLYIFPEKVTFFSKMLCFRVVKGLVMNGFWLIARCFAFMFRSWLWWFYEFKV